MTETPTNSLILKRIRDRLDAMEMSEQAAATRAGLSRDVIRNWRRDPSLLPSMRTLQALAPVLGMTVEEITGGPSATVAMPLGLSGHVAGLAESEAVPLHSHDLPQGESQWEVAPRHEAPQGYRAGDMFILNQAMTPREGDDVLATIVDRHHPRGKTILRTYRGGWLYGGPSTQPEHVDHARVSIMGVVRKAWRERRD